MVEPRLDQQSAKPIFSELVDARPQTRIQAPDSSRRSKKFRNRLGIALASSGVLVLGLASPVLAEGNGGQNNGQAKGQAQGRGNEARQQSQGNQGDRDRDEGRGSGNGQSEDKDDKGNKN